MHLTRPHHDGAATMDTHGGERAEIPFTIAGSTQQLVLVREGVDGVWRGTIDRRERRSCAIPPDATITSVYAVAVRDQPAQISVTCTAAVEGITGEATVTASRRRALANVLARARASAFERLADAVANEVEACDARFRALVDGETRWASVGDSIYVPAGLVAGARDGTGPRGSYVNARANAHVNAHAQSHARPHGTGYLAGAGFARAGSRAGLGAYGALARPTGNVLRGYMPQAAAGRLTSRPAALSASAATASVSMAPDREAEGEALAWTLLRLQTLLTALDGAAAVDA